MVRFKKLAVIIPVYNEAKTIIKTYKQVKKIGLPIIVDDCSTDETKKILKEKKIKYLSNKSNNGYEKTIKNGFNFILNNLPAIQYIATIDADLELPPKNIVKLYLHLKKKNYDIVIGSRNKLNRFSEYLLKFLFKFKYEIDDPISGLKIYKVNKLKKIIGQVTENFFLVDILFFAIKKNFKICSKNISIKKREGDPRVGNSLKVNLKIFKIIIHFFYKKIQN